MIEFRLPQLSMGMSEATVARWFVAEGEMVSEGADLVEVESDKALLALPAPASGVLLQICAPEGVDLEVHELLALIQPAE
jgi:pyruvate/2-oxoglutarate dehydrogenase complex dihydrolipoamide acyltransferase (E2) component